MPDQQTVELFFDALSDEYASVIGRCVPRYREMLTALLDYLPHGRTFDSVLELGCGTGNLSSLAAKAFPEATIRFVDISSESLQICRKRIGGEKRLRFQQGDFRQISYPPGTFDVVLSSISIHHLTSPEKQDLYRRIKLWLRPDGIFTYSDQFAGATEDLYLRHMHGWKEQSVRLGATDEDWEMWMEHQTKFDHHDSLPNQMCWLGEAGFAVVDCPWRYLLWTVLQARCSE